MKFWSKMHITKIYVFWFKKKLLQFKPIKKSIEPTDPNARYPRSPLKILKTLLFQKVAVLGSHIIRQLIQTIALD
jgi:hypothetical protein